MVRERAERLCMMNLWKGERPLKEFNTTAVCIPDEHYMVDLSERVQEIRKLVDDGKYFTINRPRQYGKTTTINELYKVLVTENVVISLDFQSIENGSFKDGGEFSRAFARIVLDAEEFDDLSIPETIIRGFKELVEKPSDQVKMDDLFRVFRMWFREEKKPIVLIIDEVDSATNNQVFWDFLSQLRSLYLKRANSNRVKTFQSVILAGVTDVRQLKKITQSEGEHKENTPWNIAADFTIDMSLSESGIQGMLDEYEADHHTGMDTAAIAKQIRAYTNGYPFLVSRICQLLDKGRIPDFGNLPDAWTQDGIDAAVRTILSEENTLFDTLMGELKAMPELCRQLKEILFEGKTIPNLPDNAQQKRLRKVGLIINDHHTVAIANRIFEMRLYNFFIGESLFAGELRGNALNNKPEFIREGKLDVPLIMKQFVETQKVIRKLDDEEAERKFIEEEGREKFLTYLWLIINGVGTFSVEEQTRDRKRMDVVIHYCGMRYIIELKIWHGESRNEEGEKQILGYMNRFGLKTGYMLSFNFNKNKEPGVHEVHIGDKLLYEGVV